MNIADRLPAALQEIAHRSGSEFAWRKSDIEWVVCKLVELDFAILGGEVWVVQGKTTAGMVSLRSGGVAVVHWDADDRDDDEDWKEFVRKSAQFALQAITDLKAEEIVISEQKDRLFYYLSLVDEIGYNRLGKENP